MRAVQLNGIKSAQDSQHVCLPPPEDSQKDVCGLLGRFKKAQEHTKTTHNMELSREQALSMARPA